MITDVDGEPVSSLEDFASRMAAFAHGQRVPLRYFRLDTVRSPEIAVVTVDRLWFKMQLCRRDDATGEWPCEASPAPPAAPTPPGRGRFDGLLCVVIVFFVKSFGNSGCGAWSGKVWNGGGARFRDLAGERGLPGAEMPNSDGPPP